MAPPPVTLEELKAHLNAKSPTATDTIEMQAKLEAATAAVETRVGPMVVREVTEQATASQGRLRLWSLPVVSLTSVEFSGSPVDVGTLSVDKIAGLVTGLMTDGLYDVVYQAGRAWVPSDLKEATLVVAAHLWETQRGSAGGAPGVPGQSFGGSPVPRGFALPHRAVELMAPHTAPLVA